MKSLHLIVVIATTAFAASAPAPVFPNETLDYSINWPSSLSLGEAHWKAHNAGNSALPRWEFDLSAEAHVPGYGLLDQYHGRSSGPNFCTEEFGRQLQHGSRTSSETVTVDSKDRTATRKTTNGGESHIKIPECVHDALAFLFYARQELVNGRIPPQEVVLLGSAYQVRLKFLGIQPVKIGDRTVDADRVSCDIKGPVASLTGEIFFAHDAVRTPVLIKIPLAMGTFSLELQR